MAKRRKRAEVDPDLLAGFALTAQSPAGIETFLSLAQRAPAGISIRQYVLFHRGDLLDLLLQKAPQARLSVEVTNRGAGALRVAPDPSVAPGLFDHLTVAVLPASEPDLHRIVAFTQATPWHWGVRPLMRKLYPEAMPVFFKQDEIRDALIALETALGPARAMRVVEATMKARRRQAGEAGPQPFDTERRWTELPVREVFDYAEAAGQWFTSIRFRVELLSEHGRARPLLSCRVYKRGEVAYDYLHEEVSTHLISRLEACAARRLALLHGRGIRERNYRPGLPIQIRFGAPVFAERAEVCRFAQVMNRYPGASKAVFHANPYYHASLADLLDGSSFEVWILSRGTVLLLPQAKSSAQAFERLIAYIFREFGEGTVGEFDGRGHPES